MLFTREDFSSAAILLNSINCDSVVVRLVDIDLRVFLALKIGVCCCYYGYQSSFGG